MCKLFWKDFSNVVFSLIPTIKKLPVIKKTTFFIQIFYWYLWTKAHYCAMSMIVLRFNAKAFNWWLSDKYAIFNCTAAYFIVYTMTQMKWYNKREKHKLLMCRLKHLHKLFSLTPPSSLEWCLFGVAHLLFCSMFIKLI